MPPGDRPARMGRAEKPEKDSEERRPGVNLGEQPAPIKATDTFDTKIAKFYNPLYQRRFSPYPFPAVRIPKAIELQREAPLRVPSAPR